LGLATNGEINDAFDAPGEPQRSEKWGKAIKYVEDNNPSDADLMKEIDKMNAQRARRAPGNLLDQAHDRLLSGWLL